MKNLIVLITLFWVGLGFAQDDETSHDLSSFSEVKVYNGLKVKMFEADENKAVVTGDNKEDVNFEIEEGILKVKMNLDNIFKDSNTEVQLYFVEINKADARQNASISFEETYKTSDLALEASEAGEIYAEIEVENLSVKSLTGAVVEVKGKTAFQDVKIRAGGKYYARYLNSENIDISISAGGVADVYATGNVLTKVRAGGTVNVYGNPESIDENTMFGGKVNRKN